jgi:predicted glycosyltransferase involved in capsule biosynthesis
MSIEKEFLEKIVIQNKINYSKLRNMDTNTFLIREDEDMLVDISVIIPVRGRYSFMQKTIDSLKNAIQNTDILISITISEHSHVEEFKSYFYEEEVNYIHISSNGEPFNKCLMMNLGFLYSTKARQYLFHDVDCQVQSDFFLRLQKNVEIKNALAIQCFYNRRVLCLNIDITEKILNNEVRIDDMFPDHPDVTIINYGAPGGSVLIEHDLFLKIGGYDPELFWSYSPEDIFFWDKIQNVTTFHSCDNPIIEQYHLYHPSSDKSNPDLKRMIELHKMFKQMHSSSQCEFLLFKKNLLLNL